MARLQVLYLPSASTGDRHEPRYALLVDQAAELDPADREALRAFANQAGAQGVVVLSGAVDLAQDDSGDEETTKALAGLLKEVMSVPDLTHAAAPQKPKLPPANTIEGKLARSWQRSDPTDGDPR